MPAACWLYADCVVAVCWLCGDCVVAACWLCGDCVVTVYRRYADCMLAVCWLYAGCMLAACWLHAGCTLAVFQLLADCPGSSDQAHRPCHRPIGRTLHCALTVRCQHTDRVAVLPTAHRPCADRRCTLVRQPAGQPDSRLQVDRRTGDQGAGTRRNKFWERQVPKSCTCR